MAVASFTFLAGSAQGSGGGPVYVPYIANDAAVTSPTQTPYIIYVTVVVYAPTSTPTATGTPTQSPTPTTTPTATPSPTPTAYGCGTPVSSEVGGGLGPWKEADRGDLPINAPTGRRVIVQAQAAPGGPDVRVYVASNTAWHTSFSAVVNPTGTADLTAWQDLTVYPEIWNGSGYVQSISMSLYLCDG